MSIQSTTDKVADNARNLANNVLQSAQDAVQSTRDVANESLEKAFAHHAIATRPWPPRRPSLARSL